MLRRNCDWALDMESLRGPNVIAVLLPEFQESRELARMLSLQSRLAIAERRYDDAIETMRMNYRLGHDVATGPLLVCGLIGIAIDGIANLTATELIAAPDSPNMYWALTELPQPMIDLRPAARFEMDFGPRMFPFINHAETTERAPARMESAVRTGGSRFWEAGWQLAHSRWRGQRWRSAERSESWHRGHRFGP